MSHHKKLLVMQISSVRMCTVPVANANRSRWCHMCHFKLIVKSISHVCWIKIQTLTYACWSLLSSSWWKRHCVFIVRSSGGSSAAILQQQISGCLCLCAQCDCFSRGLIHLVIPLKLMRYAHVAIHVTLVVFEMLIVFTIYFLIVLLICELPGYINIISKHHVHRVHSCRQLLQISWWLVVCLSVCGIVMTVSHYSRAKAAKRSHMGPIKNLELDGHTDSRQKGHFWGEYTGSL